MKIELTFGSWLKRRRRGLGLTQKELARRIGYAEVTVRKVEADALRPSGEMARKLADHLELPPEQHDQFIRFARDEAGWEDPSLPSHSVELTARVGNVHRQGADGGWQMELPAFLQTDATTTGNGLSAFVAREKELLQLQSFLSAALAGQGQVIFVTGEAGSGKTTLLKAFARLAQDKQSDLIVAVGACHVYTGVGDPYLPFREVMAMLAGDVDAAWASGAITREHAARLWRLLPHTVEALVDHGPDLLGSFVAPRALLARCAANEPQGAPWRTRLESLLADKRRQSPEQNRLYEEYVGVLRSLALRQPLLLILDDLHWADTSSIGLLFHLSRHIEDSRILVLGSFRPEEIPIDSSAGPHPLGSLVSELKRRYGQRHISLDQMETADGRYFVDSLLDTEPNRLDEHFRQALFLRGRGHPLFTVELLQDLQDRGYLRRDDHGHWQAEEKLSWDALPVKIEGVIGKRIDLLPSQWRELLTVAAVEGESFTAEVVARILRMDEGALVRLLSGELQNQHRLVRAQSIEYVRSKRLSRYRFGHNLFQTYLYDQLDTVARSHLHQAVGVVLEELYQDDEEELNNMAARLAHHFQEARIEEKAIDYRLRAGRHATQMSANDEAIAHLSEGLNLLESLPDTLERDRKELTMQTALSVPLMTGDGFASSKVEQVAQRACDLAQKLGNVSQLFRSLYGLWGFRLLRAELDKTLEISEALMDVAQTAQDSGYLLEAHRAFGLTLYHLAKFQPALTHVEQGIALYDLKAHRHHSFLYGRDPVVSCYNYLIHSLWMLGYPDQAQAKIEEFLHLSRKLEHPYSVAYAFEYGVTIGYQLLREVELARHAVEEGLALARKHGFPFLAAHATIMRGWAIAEQDDPKTGIAEMRRGLDAWHTTGASAHQAYFCCLLAGAYMKLGDVDAGLTTVAEGFAAIAATNERYAEAELYRLQGELLRMQNLPDAAADAYTAAIAVARRQGARSLELRAATSFARLRRHQGQISQAWGTLDGIYRWFSEGFNTPDLIEARTLLDSLVSPD